MSFIRKEVSSKMMLNSRSALPMKVKRPVLTQEVLRFLLNCNPEIPWERTVGNVNNMIANDRSVQADTEPARLSAFNTAEDAHIRNVITLMYREHIPH